MPIISTKLLGKTSTQASGQVRGTLDFIFADGRTVRKDVRAANTNAWDSLIVDLHAHVQSQAEHSDAASNIDGTAEIASTGEANIKQRAVAYLRAAMSTEQAFDAFLLLGKFNDFRLAQGWNLDQVVSGLASAELDSDEWERIKTVYQYLSDAGRPEAMSSAKVIQAQWESR